MIAQLAEAIAELLTDPSILKIRECDADDCVMLFLLPIRAPAGCSASPLRQSGVRSPALPAPQN
jgi:predicted RNA-binding Zn ribbon-like protein